MSLTPGDMGKSENLETPVINEPQVLLEWTHSIGLLKNVRFMRNMALAFAIPVLLMGLFIGLLTGSLLAVAIVIFGVGGGFFVIGFLITAAIAQWTDHFTLSTEGVRQRAAGASASLAGVAGGGALAAGHAGAAAGALMELGRFIRWSDTSKIRVDERRSEILLRPVSLIKPVVLHCEPVLFPQVLDIVHRHVPSDAWERRRRPKP
jgi:hypothetical protein